MFKATVRTVRSRKGELCTQVRPQHFQAMAEIPKQAQKIPRVDPGREEVCWATQSPAVTGHWVRPSYSDLLSKYGCSDCPSCSQMHCQVSAWKSPCWKLVCSSVACQITKFGPDAVIYSMEFSGPKDCNPVDYKWPKPHRAGLCWKIKRYWADLAGREADTELQLKTVLIATFITNLKEGVYIS